MPAQPVVVLSGPSFAVGGRARAADGRARRVDRRRPRRRSCRTASAVPRCGSTAATTSSGVEIGGALKNVIAIAAGVVEGLGLGHNALAALITRGLAEISRLACAEGGRRETLAGLERARRSRADLHRRPQPQPARRASSWRAAGRSQDILAGMKMVAEGVRTTGAALALGARHGVELPIAAADGRGARRASARPRASAVEALMLRASSGPEAERR